MKSGPNRKANVLIARVIPVFLLALIIYSTWVFTRLLAVDYLLDPSPSLGVSRRIGPAIALLIIYYLLLLPVLICYARLFFTIIANPGFVPRGAQWHIQKAQKTEARKSARSHKKSSRHNVLDEKKAEAKWSGNSDTLSQIRDDEFWQRDIFICNYDGRPPFCSHCLNYKLDRVHHCSEVNRCVRKMDHFCPWVGGIISETSFKFFIQFTFYVALYTLSILITVSYYVAERRRLTPGWINVHWILILALSALFLLFGTGMFLSSFQLSWNNRTTVESLSKAKVYYLAIHMPRPQETLQKNEAAGNHSLRTITYPRPHEEQLLILEQHGANISSSTITTPPAAAGQTLLIPVGTMGAPNSRTFAIFQTMPGTNPWNLGSALANIRQVMGYRIVDWFLPVRHSPCASHDSQTSMFKLNPELEEFQREAGIKDQPVNGDTARRSRRKKRRSTSQVQEGQSSAEESEHGRGKNRVRRSSQRRKRRYGNDAAGQS